MHPQKFLSSGAESAPQEIDENQRAALLGELSTTLAGFRKEDVDARRASGIEDIWLAAEEAYVGIDDANRGEFSGAKWSKPTSMSGGLTTGSGKGTEEGRSSAYLRMTARYVDHATAKICEIILPIDDRAFSIKPKAVPDQMPLGVIQQAMGSPAAAPAMMGAQPQPPTAQQPIQVPGAPQGQQTDSAPDDGAMAKAAEDRIYSWMQGAKHPREMRKMLFDAARIGVGVIKGPFPDVRMSKAMTTNAKGVLGMVLREDVQPSEKRIDPWDFFPAKGCGENINDGDHVWERDTLSERKLRALKKRPEYIDSQIDEVLRQGPGGVYLDAARKDSKDIDDLYEIWYFTGYIKREVLAATNAKGQDTLDDDADDIPVVVAMVNDVVISVVLNHFDSGAFGYHVLSWSRRTGHWAGVGIGEQLSMPQRAVNAAIRSLFNNAGLSAGVQIVLDQLAIEPADGSWKLTPNKLWYMTEEGAAKRVSDAFAAIQIPSVQAQLSAIIEFALKMAEESTSIPLVTQGQTGPTTPDTFGQAELQNNNAHAWLRSIGESVDDCITEPMVDLYYEWLLIDPDVPDNEKGEFTVDAKGSSAMVERAIQEQVMLGLLQASANPAFELDPAKLMQEHLRSKRLDPRRVRLTDEQIAQRNAQPAPPPVQVQVQELRNQGAMQQTQAEVHGELLKIAADQAHEQQLLQQGGTTPHMAAAQARVAVAQINAEARAGESQTKAQAELAYVQTERDIAAQNAVAAHQERQDKLQLAMLDYANKRNITLDQLKAELAKTSMQEQTKRQLAQAQIQVMRSENEQDRQVDLHKHHNPVPTGELPVAPQ